MRVTCAIPWRAGQPDRERHHTIVRQRIQRILPDAVHIDVDSDQQPFSRAGSRNHAVQAATDDGSDIVVLCDADTLPEPVPLINAIHEAPGTQRLHLPYTHYRGLSQQGTSEYLHGSMPDECETELAHEWATGGVLVIRPDAWWRAGGMDERFTGYGFEDVALRLAADAILGPTVRHPGTITHLWHPKAMGLGSPEHAAGAELCARYQAAEGDPAAMVRLVDEHHTPVRR